jgi:hypothetical protein
MLALKLRFFKPESLPLRKITVLSITSIKDFKFSDKNVCVFPHKFTQSPDTGLSLLKV